jgi:ribose 5-phosphate isomerase RpiB
MAKRYATTYSNGCAIESSSAHEARNFVNHDDAQKFFLSGKQVGAAEFFAAVDTAVQAAWDKKSETHKRVSVQHGATQFGRVTKWVRR